MKIKIYIFALMIVSISTPITLRANIEADTNVEISLEEKIDVRKMELRNKLWRQEIEERRTDYQEKREAYRNSDEENKRIMRGEFRAAFIARFKFAIDKLSEFQTRMDTKLDKEAEAGVNVEAARIELNESISYMGSIQTNVDALKILMSKDYSEEEREAKKTEARSLFEKIKADIKASHMALKDCLKELRLAKNTKVEADAQLEANLPE